MTTQNVLAFPFTPPRAVVAAMQGPWLGIRCKACWPTRCHARGRSRNHGYLDRPECELVQISVPCVPAIQITADVAKSL